MKDADRVVLESILAAQVLLLAHEMRKEQRKMNSTGSTEFVDEATQLIRQKRAQIVDAVSSTS